MELTIENLKVKLQKDEILHEVSLKIEDGQFVSLLGASGCGKTTLLKSIAGLLDVESGDILLDNQSIVNVPPEKRGTVIVFQDLRLFPHMTVEKNIMFPMELQNVPKDVQKQTVKRLLEDVQLPGYEKRKIKEMSGGQKQRVALARALAANPKILLLDEPFSGLDEKLRLEMGSLVKRLHEEWKITTILVTHDKREALQMSDKIALMNEGRILQYAAPTDIFYRPVSKEVADYFGKANYIEGIVDDGIFKSNCVEVRTDYPNGKVTAMVRPYAIRLIEGEGKSLIRDLSFMGEMVELVLETPDGNIECMLSYEELQSRQLQKGSKVDFEVQDKDITIFE